jgi:hypothetical protein
MHLRSPIALLALTISGCGGSLTEPAVLARVKVGVIDRGGNLDGVLEAPPTATVRRP